MIYKEYEIITDFLKVTEDLFIKKEELCSLMYGIALKLKNNLYHYGSMPLLATITSGESIALAVMMTPPFKIQVLSSNAGYDSDEIDYLAENLYKNRWKIPAIIAERSMAQAFSARWSNLTGMSYETDMEQRIHALYSVNRTFTPPGNICKATENDLDTVLQWSRKFYFDCYGKENENENLDYIREDIQSNNVYFWVDKHPVSMAQRGRPTPNGETINLVYTPPEQRKRGYATALVASLSQMILDEGKRFCTLFTDLKNPTSNKIYKRIGYKPIADMVDINFI